MREQLRARVTSLPPGAVLPSEPLLCSEFRVSRITLRHAVDDLVFERYLSREHGRGVFVLPPQLRSRYRERFADTISGFYERQTALGHTVTTTVVDRRVVPIGLSIAAGTVEVGTRGLEPGPVLALGRLRYVNGTLHHLADTVIPLDRFADAVDADFSRGSLYDFLRSHHGVVLSRNDVVVSVQAAPERVAEALGVPVAEKLLRVVSTMFDDEDRIVAYGSTHFTPGNSAVSFGLRS